MNLYQRINGADWCNIFVVGDLHGCYTLLMNELDKVSFDPARDLLISVGDLVDRGQRRKFRTLDVKRRWMVAPT